MLNHELIQQLEKQGKPVKTVETQISYFVEGFPFIKLIRPATVGDGVLRLSSEDLTNYQDYFEEKSKNVRLLKFVPASGAASRMFKSLFSFIEQYNGTPEELKKLKKDQSPDSVNTFLNNLEKFAFFDDLKNRMEQDGINLMSSLESGKYKVILEYILYDHGLGYGNLPKGLLKFHRYLDHVRTPVEEHLVEGSSYARNGNGDVFIHFTVSPEHEEKFNSHIREVLERYEEEFGVTYQISYSQQKPITDTVAVDLQNSPFRNEDGTILFRPAGHGALLRNLDELEADIVFIKNIDNVVPDRLKEETIAYKMVLSGVLLSLQEKIFNYLRILENEDIPGPEMMNEIQEFLEKELCIETPAGRSQMEAKPYFMQKLNRPIRVCGMVKNEGEPGGGPFWAVNPDGTVSLQIVESAQVDFNNPVQKDIANSATHFNPVDLVCAIRDFKGNKFNLPDFVDHQTGFISRKSQGGKDLKALELPGLWNGSMSDWNTVFVEVPIGTFNPVKVVNDLLRPQHQ